MLLSISLKTKEVDGFDSMEKTSGGKEINSIIGLLKINEFMTTEKENNEMMADTIITQPRRYCCN